MEKGTDALPHVVKSGGGDMKKGTDMLPHLFGTPLTSTMMANSGNNDCLHGNKTRAPKIGGSDTNMN